MAYKKPDELAENLVNYDQSQWLTTMGSKMKKMKQEAALSDTPYYVKEDYPTYILEKGKMLQEQIKMERE